MKKLVKITAKKLAMMLSFFVSRTRLTLYLWQLVDTNLHNRYRIIKYADITMKFVCPNYVISSRLESFATKEPQTLRWIESIPFGSNIWDVGANIGLYSVYAAKRGLHVFAFEPSPLNLRSLTDNFYLNNIQNATIIPLPLNNKVEIAQLDSSQDFEGASQATFMHEVDQFGKTIRPSTSFKTIGVSIDWIVDQGLVPCPDYIKLDVDGIEHFILQGAGKSLMSVKGILLEVNTVFSEQSESINNLLETSGFKLISQESLGSKFMENQIWEKQGGQ